VKYEGLNRYVSFRDIVQITDADHPRHLWIGRIYAMSIHSPSTGVTVEFGDGRRFPTVVAALMFVDRPNSPFEEERHEDHSV